MARKYGASKSRAYLSSGKAVKELLEAYGAAVVDAGKAKLKDGAEEIAAEARRLCPVETGRYARHPGRLAGSIHVDDVSKGKGELLAIIADAKAGKNADGICYGPIVEYSPRIGKRFMYPAYDAKIGGVREGIIEAMREAARKHGGH